MSSSNYRTGQVHYTNLAWTGLNVTMEAPVIPSFCCCCCLCNSFVWWISHIIRNHRGLQVYNVYNIGCKVEHFPINIPKAFNGQFQMTKHGKGSFNLGLSHVHHWNSLKNRSLLVHLSSIVIKAHTVAVFGVTFQSVSLVIGTSVGLGCAWTSGQKSSASKPHVLGTTRTLRCSAKLFHEFLFRKCAK